MPESKRISIREFVDFGFLQEVNRQFLHPLGLALEVASDAAGGAWLVGVRDCRDDPEGIIFDGFDEDGHAKAEKVAALQREKAAARLASLGYVVEPVGEVPACLS